MARLVLANNADQNVLLLNDRHLVLEWSPGFERTMDWLENASELDRGQEALPSTEQLRERLRSGKGLTSPELSVLAGYAKIELAKELNSSDLADDPWFRGTLRSYFPRQVSERFESELDCASAAPPDHLHRGGQRHDQPRRNHLRLPGHRGNHRHGRRGGPGLRGGTRGLRPALDHGPAGRLAAGLPE